MSRSPFLIDGPTCIQLSGGRTSARMLDGVLQENSGLPDDTVVCFENTGKEDELTLQFVRDIETMWRVPIIWLEYRYVAQPTAPWGIYEKALLTEAFPKLLPDNRFAKVAFDTASRNGEPFDAVIRQRGGILPNPRSRYCSSELKTRTAHRYLRSIGWTEWDTMIGVRSDEPRRVAKFRANPHPESKAETIRLPLADAGISVAEVIEFWKSQPFDLGLQNVNGITPEGNCDLCMLKPAARVLSLIQAQPERGIWWAKKEQEAESVARGNGCRFRDDRPSYAQMLKFAAQQVDMFDAQEEAIACFCGD